MNKGKYPHVKVGLGLLFCPALAGACFGVFLVSIGLMEDEQLGVLDISFASILLAPFRLLLILLACSFVGEWMYFPPAFVLSIISLSFRPKRTALSTALLSLTGGVLASIWGWILNHWVLSKPSLGQIGALGNSGYIASFILGTFSTLIMSRMVLPKKVQCATPPNNSPGETADTHHPPSEAPTSP